jgi:kynureninase
VIDLAGLAASPNQLAEHYSRFRVADRMLLTGHSHQAWPDRAEVGQQRAFDDAADLVDGKWERAFAVAERVRRGFALRLDDADGLYSLSSSTHDLIVRFLSSLDLRRRPRLVTTDGEFHTIDRQLRRLAEEGVEITRVSSDPAADVGERLAGEVDDRTAAVLTSTVFFGSGEIAGPLDDLVASCRMVGAELLLDVYHQLNVVPASLEGMGDVFVVGGGYKYCQIGEGNCFLRYPRDCRLRPVVTGWFAAFADLEVVDRTGPVAYSDDAWRFAGATFDPTSHYRASEVFDFFDEMGLSPTFLREVSQHQVGLLCRLFDDLDLDPSVIDRKRDVPLDGVGGFLALRTPHAASIQSALEDRGVKTDYRHNVLRLGPAPYLSDRQLEEAISALGDVARDIGRPGTGPFDSTTGSRRR